MEKPLISVIVPVYKVEKYLDRCVESIVNQTYENLEIILVDDGSPDNCPQMCDAWAEKDSRIKVIHKENGGVSSARNIGLDSATGEYIGFVDSDDYIEPEMYEMLMNALVEHYADIAVCNNTHVDENNKRIDNDAGYQFDTFENENVMRSFLHGDHYDITSICNKCYLRKVINDLRFDSNITVGEDVLYNYCGFKSANRIVVVENYLYNYTFRSASAMRSGNPDVFSRWKIIKRIADLEKNSVNYSIAIAKYASELSCVARELIRSKNDKLINMCYPEIVAGVKESFAEFKKFKDEINKKVFASLKMMYKTPELFLAMMKAYYKLRG